MKAKVLIPVIALAGIIGAFGFWRYAICAHTVGADSFLVLTRKYGDPKPADQILAKDGQRGVLETTFGTGRHFINPIIYDVRRYPAKKIGATSVGIVTSKAGPSPKSGTVIAERGERGIWREVLGPGKYKMNPVAYTIDVVPMVRIPPGHVGVLIDSISAKVLDRTLPPGLHKINTRLFNVEIVEVGVKHLGLSRRGRNIITEKMLMEDDMPVKIRQIKNPMGGALGFPSQDGFNVGLDASIVYEVTPTQAVQLISQYGTIDVLTSRIIDPALNSVTRNVGSSVTAKAIIQGETRIDFQRTFTERFLEELAAKPVHAIDALPRGLYVLPKIQLPIMQATIKQELKLTNKEIELTTELQNTEEKERKKINLEIEKVRSMTEYEVTNIESEISKEVQKYEAETEQLIARIKLELAKIDAQTRLVRSQGEAEVITYSGQKKASLLRSKATALGGMDNLVLLNFVESLPERIPFKVIHSGEGTLWTDLKGLTADQGAVLGQLKKLMKNPR